MYESPIDIIYGEMETQIENDVLKAVQRVGVNVNKEELLKALQYDREQYSKGYNDGLNADRWIPCSERLPDSGVDVNITTRSSIVGVGSFFEETNEWVQWYCGGGIVVDVIAWQPLPEPYKGE